MFPLLCKVIVRKLLVRKGRLIVALCLFLLGVLGTFYFRTDSNLLISEPARTIRVPSLNSGVGTNSSSSPAHPDKHLPASNASVHRLPVTMAVIPSHGGGVAVQVEGEEEDERVPLAHGGVAPRVMASDTAECITPALQPAPGQFHIQTSSLMESLPFDNINGGVWKQGYDLTYSMSDFTAHPLKVIVVPHSHNDPGWLKTFEDYYRRQTRNILTLMTNALAEDPRKRFIWAEISYLDLWWREQSDFMKDRFKRLVANGQLEIVTGGWVMNDEANTHYYSMVDQLVEGHLWMQKHLPGVVPKSGWAIDPFGYSPTMTYLLHNSGLEFTVIQRGHYHIKKHLARTKGLEFRWVQEWDRGFDTNLLCHLMPFYIYDIPHTCGPDPKICCQFDFNRLPGSRVSCPWRVRPTAISDHNVRERAEVLADQYRKKSTLFKTNVVLVPLGDDFRWDTTKEISAQFSNYFKLMDYMNTHPEMKIHVEFGTLHDYYKAVQESVIDSAGGGGVGGRRGGNSSREDVLNTFPTLAGDFFTYADRDDHYWSGYFTSRPFHKHMDRILSYHLRMAEILSSIAMAKGLTVDGGHTQLLTEARRDLGLFQHHDAITGTAKDPVVNDYAVRMVSAIKKSKSVAQDVLRALLSTPDSHEVAGTMTLAPEDTYPNIKTLPKMAIIDVTNEKSTTVTFVNSLAQRRVMLVSVMVNSPTIRVTDFKGEVLSCQISPVLEGEVPSTDKFVAVFEASLPALGLAHYRVAGTGGQLDKHTVTATLQFINMRPPQQRHPVFDMESSPSGSDFVLSTSHNVSCKFSGQNGLLKSMTVGPSEVELNLDFVTYGTRRGRDKSGAYLFLPEKDAVTMVGSSKPHVVVMAGPLVQEVTSFLPEVQHSVILSNSPSLDGRSLTIHNSVDIRPYKTNKELVMRIKSSVDNKDIFYTDLNGFQLTRRKTYSKVPLQGNFYPMPAMALLQDDNLRLTLCSRQPLGVASLRSGWLEVVLDRKLLQDDNRGLGQGVKDSVLTFEPFKLLLERRLSNLKPTMALVYPSLLSQYTLDSLLHPPSKFLSPHSPASSSTPVLPPVSFLQKPLPCDIFLLNLRSVRDVSQKSTDAILTLHRRGFDCGFDMASLQCQVRGGEVRLGSIFKDITISEAMETSLSLFHTGKQLDLKKELSSHIDVMHIQTYRVAW